MLTTILDKIGEYNPQLFRELKGNIKKRNLILTAIITIVLQIMITSMFSQTDCLDYDQVNYICRDSERIIEWQYLFRAFNYMLPLIAYIGGVYQLVADLSKEQTRGTLNFIRLTPQSSYKILSGKILGTPILIYLGIIACLPLHFLAGISSGMSLFWMLGIYTLWIAGGLLFSVIATFYTLLIGTQSKLSAATTSVNGLGCVIAFVLGLPYIQMIDFAHELYQQDPIYLDKFTWFLLPIALNAFIGYLWLIISVCTLTYFIWEAVNRRFNNPTTTPLSKIQGYGLMSCFQLWLLGFVIPSYGGGIRSEHFGVALGFMFFAIPVSLLVLMVSITPHRQTLLDWSRYRHKMNNPKNIWRDLLIGEKSPAILAIAVNALFTIVLWSSWVFLVPKEARFNIPDLSIFQVTISLVLTMGMALIYALVIQLSLLMKTQKRSVFSIAIVCIVIITPLVLGGMFAAESFHIPLIWAFSPAPILLFMEGGISSVIFGFIGQILLLSSLTSKLQNKLKKAGESETKAILTS